MADTAVERLSEFRGNDLVDLSDAAEAAIVGGGGFGWLSPPPRDVMEAYWRGTLLVPGRTVIIGRLDGVIAGSAQLNRPRANAESQSFSVSVSTFFLAPWARGHGIAPGILEMCAARGLYRAQSGCGRNAGARDPDLRGKRLPALGRASVLCARRRRVSAGFLLHQVVMRIGTAP
jgi:hypothetical protein